MATSRLDDLRVENLVLTKLSRGYSNNAFIGDKACPFVKVDKEKGKIPNWGKEAFRTYDSKRAIGAVVNRIGGVGITLVDYSTTQHALDSAIDDRERAEAMFDIEGQRTTQVTEALRLEHEIEVATIMQNADLYDSSMTVKLTDKQFNDSGADPYVTFTDAIKAVRGNIGKRPNAVFMGESVMEALKNNAALLDRVKYSQFGILDEATLGKIIGISNIFVGGSVYTTDDKTFTEIWKDNVIFVYLTTPKGVAATPQEPCYGYTLEREAQKVTKWRDESVKSDIISVSHNYCVKIVGQESAYLIEDCVQ